MDILKELRSNPFLLAPMAGVTDNAFRSFMKEMGAHILMTELVSSNGLLYESQNTLEITKFEEIQRPLGIQIFGDDPVKMKDAALLLEKSGADFIDLNFGCPVKKVVQKGAGAATLKEPLKLRNILKTIRSELKIPLTIKIRTGWDENSRNAIEVCQIAYDEGVTWVTIHGRTRAQSYSGLADWDFIGNVKANSKIPIIGNGDVQTPQLAVDRLQKYNLDGVMIGRGALKNPWIFKQSYLLWKEKQFLIQNDFIIVFQRLKHFLELLSNPRLTLIQLQKFAAWYSTGYRDASTFRKSLYQTKDTSELFDIIMVYFSKLDTSLQEIKMEDNILRSGHG